MTQPYTQILTQAVLVVAVLVLLYCLYVVQDWLDMLTHDQVPACQPSKVHKLPPLYNTFHQCSPQSGGKKEVGSHGSIWKRAKRGSR